MPCLKGVKMSYLYTTGKRRCLQCGVFTRVGCLMVHALGKYARNEAGDSENHWICERCMNCSLANLPPQCFCLVCLRVPKAIYCTPPMISGGTVICEGYRRYEDNVNLAVLHFLLRRNVLSQGGAEVFTASTLVGHVNDCMLSLNSRRLRLLPYAPPAPGPQGPGDDMDQDGGSAASNQTCIPSNNTGDE